MPFDSLEIRSSFYSRLGGREARLAGATIPRMGVLWDYAPSAFEPRDGERPLLVDNPTRAFVFA
jgi:hypothetical protein